MAKWEPLDTPNRSISEEPWDFYWQEWKSGTKEFEDFLHDPKKVLSEEIPSIKSDYYVQSMIVNHDIGLNGSAVCSTCLVDPRRKTVYLMLYKH